jgi:hypothetical protein
MTVSINPFSICLARLGPDATGEYADRLRFALLAGEAWYAAVGTNANLGSGPAAYCLSWFGSLVGTDSHEYHFLAKRLQPMLNQEALGQ